MIIECEKCQARFRLDDSKIKDSGVKVRCKNCAHIFVVTKDAAPGELDEENGGEGLSGGDAFAAMGPFEPSLDVDEQNMSISENFFSDEKEEDINSIFNDFSRTEESESLQGDVSSSTNKTSQAQDTPGAVFEPDADSSNAKQDLNMNIGEGPFAHFEDFSSASFDLDDKDASDNNNQGEFDPENETHPDFALADNGSYGDDIDMGGDFDLGPSSTATQEKKTSSLVDEVVFAGFQNNDSGSLFGDDDENEDDIPSSFPEEDAIASHLNGDPLESSGEESADFSFETVSEEPGEPKEKQAAPHPFLNNRSSFSADKSDDDELPSFGIDTSDMDASPFPEENVVKTYGEIDFSNAPSDQIELDAEEPNPLAEEAKRESDMAKVADLQRKNKTAKSKPVHEHTHFETKKRSGVSMITVMLLLICSVAGGAYYYLDSVAFFNLDSAYIQQVIQKYNTGEAGEKKGAISVSELKGYYLQTSSEGMIFVVEGKVYNNYAAPRRFIRLRANLYDERTNILSKNDAFGGNVLDKKELKQLSRDKIREAMDYKVGKGLINSAILPGQGIPFMIVCFDAPDALAEFNVDIISSEETTES